MDGKAVVPGNRLGRTLDFRGGKGVYSRGSYFYSSMVGKVKVYQSSKSSNLQKDRTGQSTGQNLDEGSESESKSDTEDQPIVRTLPILEVIPLTSDKLKGGVGSTFMNRKRNISLKRKLEDAVIKEGDIVTGIVSRITLRYAQVDIIAIGFVELLDQYEEDNGEKDKMVLSNQKINSIVETGLLRETYSGVIRKEDIRLTEVDRVVVNECFLPGDLVSCRVISLGDARQYYLSTAEDNLGVRCAKSKKGHVASSLEYRYRKRALLRPSNWEEMICPLTNEIEKRKVAKP